MHKYSFLLFFFILSISALRAQEIKPLADPQVFLSKLKQVSLTTSSIQTDFAEEKFLSYLKEPQKATGIFYYKKENKMRWEKIKPSSYIFLVNGKTVRIKEDQKERDISSFNQVVTKIKEMMIGLVSGEFNANKQYTPVYFENEKNYVIKLLPKNKKIAFVFDYIQLTFTKETMRLKELAFYEKSGDKSIMKFFNEKINPLLSDELFTDF